jgi:hypothetical protein
MYRLVMAIRPEALPTDTAALTEMVLALTAENEKLRVAMQTLKDMIFGRRSERLAVLAAEQFALDLGDLETGVTPPEAAIDHARVAKPSGKAPRKKARRNIGALPKQASLVNTAKLHVLDPQVYLIDVLERIVSGQTKSHQLHELLAWNWKAARERAAQAAA